MVYVGTEQVDIRAHAVVEGQAEIVKYAPKGSAFLGGQILTSGEDSLRNARGENSNPFISTNHSD